MASSRPASSEEAAPETWSADPPVVSVIVPVRNDAARLRRCLTTILANDYPAGRIEIIVADNGSTDDSADAARALGARLVPLPGISVAALRNRAAAGATGDVLAFVDADHEVDRGWLASAIACLAEPNAGIVGALYTPPPAGTWVQRMYGGLRGITHGRADVEWLGSGNMALRREAFERVGGFDVRLESCEDVDLCQRLRAAGLRVIADERLRSVHHGDPAHLSKLFRSELWRGRDNLRVSLRQGLTLRSLPSVFIPVIDAICLVAALVALAAAFIVGPRALAIAAVALVPPLALATLRAWRIARTVQPRGLVDLAQAWIVAATYDAARALALLTRAGHHRDHRSRA